MSHEGARDPLRLAAAAAAASLLSFLYFYRHGQILLYGDAVAHIAIARRVFDSLKPSLLHLGTVWLPLPHLLILPFVVPDDWWQSGVGGSIPSMIAYVAGTVGLFRLVRARASRLAAWLAAVVFALNANLLYLQSTAMTEPLYLALFVWGVLFLDEFVRTRQEDPDGAARSLRRCAALLAAGMLTRYDAWVLTCAIGVIATVLVWRRGTIPAQGLSRLRRAWMLFVLVGAAVPAFWFLYNYVRWGDPLDFARGQYSAKAIAERTLPATFHYPGLHSPTVAALFFLKSAVLNLGGEGRWQWVLLWVALAGTLWMLARRRERWTWLLLWLPLPFYALAIAYGSVPIYVPMWWPFGYYNLRYGLQLLPAVAVFVAAAFDSLTMPPRARVAAIVAVLALVAGSALASWRGTPICQREAQVNSVTRVPFEKALARELARLPATARFLMFTGGHPGALQTAGIPLHRTLNETLHPEWEQALANPASSADYVVAIDGDPVAAAVAAHPQNLEALVIVETPGQGRATIYGVRPTIP
jgi:4-amino-4-deoxy-L-arabinose transferase-like glycosyltransferase